jgi:hypothetical protein
MSAALQKTVTHSELRNFIQIPRKNANRHKVMPFSAQRQPAAVQTVA